MGLPAAVHATFAGALVTSLERDVLLRALHCAIAGLLPESEEVQDLAAKVAPELHKLTADWDELLSRARDARPPA
jgi:hypothetical protein